MLFIAASRDVKAEALVIIRLKGLEAPGGLDGELILGICSTPALVPKLTGIPGDKPRGHVVAGASVIVVWHYRSPRTSPLER
jgi:hypothetical protein